MNYYEHCDRLTGPHKEMTQLVIDEMVRAADDLRILKNFDGADRIKHALSRCHVTVQFPKDAAAVWSFE